MKPIIIILFIILFIYFLYTASKKAKEYNLQKEYSLCYRLTLTNISSATKRLNSSIKKIKEINNNEYLTKFYILKLYTDLMNKNDCQSSLDFIDINHLITKNNKLNNEIASRNGDSLYFIIIDMLCAYHQHKENIVEILYQKINIHADFLNKYIEYDLIKAVYNSLTQKEDKGINFYNSLIENDKKSNYEKEIAQIYKDTAITMKKYLGYYLSQNETEEYNKFKKSLIGSTIIKNINNE